MKWPFKSKKPKQPSYEDRIERLIKLGCDQQMIENIRSTFLSTDTLDCVAIFIVTSKGLANDWNQLLTLTSTAFGNSKNDPQKRNVQFHALQIVEAFKKLK